LRCSSGSRRQRPPSSKAYLVVDDLTTWKDPQKGGFFFVFLNDSYIQFKPQKLSACMAEKSSGAPGAGVGPEDQVLHCGKKTGRHRYQEVLLPLATSRKQYFGPRRSRTQLLLPAASISSRSSRELIIPSPQAASPRGCSAGSPDRGNSDRATCFHLRRTAAPYSSPLPRRYVFPLLPRLLGATCKGEEDRLPDDPAEESEAVMLRVRMYEYNEHNKSLFSGAIGAAQHINITTLFSGVRTVIRHLI